MGENKVLVMYLWVGWWRRGACAFDHVLAGSQLCRLDVATVFLLILDTLDYADDLIILHLNDYSSLDFASSGIEYCSHRFPMVLYCYQVPVGWFTAKNSHGFEITLN